MNMCSLNNSVLLLFALFPRFCNSKITFPIGAVFDENDFDTSLAFYYSVTHSNVFNPDYYYDPKMKIISSDDIYSSSESTCSLIGSKNGILAMFGPGSSGISGMVHSICNKLEIPYLRTTWSPVDNTSPTVLNLYPEIKLLAKGLATIVRKMHWRTYAILYEENYALVRLQEVLKMTQIGDKPVVVRQLLPGEDQRSLLKQMKNITTNNFILDCNVDTTLKILTQAKEIGLLSFYRSFLLINMDSHTLNFESLHPSANITTVRIINPKNLRLNYSVHNLIFKELQKGKTLNITAETITTKAALMIDAINLLLEALPELHLTQEISPQSRNCSQHYVFDDGLRTATYLKLRPLDNPASGPLEFDKLGHRINFKLELVQIIHNNKEVIATWQPEQGSDITRTKSGKDQKQQILSSLSDQHIVVSSRIGEPYLMEKKPAVPGEILRGNDRYEGFSLSLIEAIAQKLNFTYTFHMAADTKYGNWDEQKQSWNGLIKDILDDTAQIAICDLTITEKRREVVDFSLPFMTLGISMLHKKSTKTAEENIYAFLLPLSTDVWLFIAMLYLVVSITMFFVARLCPADWENPHPCNNNPKELENVWDIQNCIWAPLGTITQQGCYIMPRGTSTRLIISSWSFFSLIITNSYSANLTAFLTKGQMGSQISSATELAQQSKIKYGVVDGGATQAFFKDSSFLTYRRMWTNMQSFKPSVFEKNNNEGVRRVKTAKDQQYVFIMESSSIEYEIEKDCNLTQIGDWLDSKGYGIAMPIDAPYRSEINSAILSLQREGEIDNLKNLWWKERNQKENCAVGSSEGSESRRLGFSNVGGLFIVMSVGVSTAFLISIWEFVWHAQTIAVENHISFRTAAILGLKLVAKFWTERKPAKICPGSQIGNY